MIPLIQIIVGARPNFMKAAPVVDEIRRRHSDWRIEVVHTGQHYDEKMSDLFFRQLGMPEPLVNLGVGSGSAAVQTARIMVALEERFAGERPDLVIVFGDVNSTLAAALVTSKLGVKLAHVEAGLRSFDRTMPEEVNRILTDAVSDFLFVTEESGVKNLRSEGVAPGTIFLVGNTMIDTLLKHSERAFALDMPARLGIPRGRYVVVTLHRPANVDDPQNLRRFVTAFLKLADHDIPIVFPVHPRTAARLSEFGVAEQLASRPLIRLVDPLGYLEFLGTMRSAGAILTDSGGIQEEATILRVPCLTLRHNTERPSTLAGGANQLVGDDPQRIVRECLAIIGGERHVVHTPPPLWDGMAAQRICDVLEAELANEERNASSATARSSRLDPV